MKKHLFGAALAAVLAVSAAPAAFAGELDYNYVEAKIATVGGDVDDAMGFQFDGSYQFHEHGFVFGGYKWQESDESSYRSINREVKVGVGGIYPLSVKTHLVGSVAFDRGFSSFATDELPGVLPSTYVKSEVDSLGLEVGVRHAFKPGIELYAFGGYVELDGGKIKESKVDGVSTGFVGSFDAEGDDTYVRVGGLYDLGAKFHAPYVKGLHLVAEVKASSDFHEIAVGVRKGF